MILVSDIIQEMRASIDADDTTYYRVDRDLIPAINKAVRSVLSVLNKVLSANRLSDESVREISKFVVKDVTEGSVLIPQAEMATIWAITLISPDPVLNQDGTLKELTKWAERVSSERWAKATGNPFEPSNTAILTGDLVQYGYMTYATKTGTAIKIRPNTITKAAVGYIEKIKDVNTESDTIALPFSIYPMLLEKALWFLSYKQGDQTTLASVTSNEINQLTTLLV